MKGMTLMSRTFRAPRWGSSAVWAGVLALALTVLAALGLVSQASAAFTTSKCDGADITGRGASFARDAHNVFINNFEPVFCEGLPSPTITYEALGSGAGRLAVKVRTDAPRFGMTDEPPTVAEVNEMNSGGALIGAPPVFTVDSDPSNDGKIHVVPAAVGAVAPLVNFPNACNVELLPPASRTVEQNNDADATPDDVMRVLFTKAQFESIWEKDPAADTWDEVFPTLAVDADCQKPIVRVVRFDDSGTTFSFKDYLNAIDGGEGWLTTYNPSGGEKTRKWPEATFGDRDDCDDAPNGIAEASDPDGPGSPGLAGDTDQLTSGCSNGNGSLVAKLVATDGSVGYSDISTARANSPSLAITPEADDNDTYWTQVQNGSGTFTEPTSSPNGFRSDGPKGANCSKTTFKEVPSSTFGDWSKVSGVNAPEGYGICTMTYGLVFDDNSDVWGGGPVEEAKARTVKDYWENALSVPAQAALFPNDYAQLPKSLLEIAKKGIESVNWEGAPVTQVPPPTPPSGGGGGVLPLGPPNNKFSLPRKTISSKTGAATIAVKVPGPGKVELVGTANVSAANTARKNKKSITVGRVVLNASKAGTFNLTLKPSAKAKQQLRKAGKLRVSLKVTFTPTGGTASVSNSSVTLKLTKKRK
jgi:ABC-type phosphate transport system substrate-binding protein